MMNVVLTRSFVLNNDEFCRIPFNDQVIMVHSGLRGAIAYSLGELNMMNSLSKMMNFVSNMMTFVSKMMNVKSQIMDSLLQNDEFCIQNDELPPQPSVSRPKISRT